MIRVSNIHIPLSYSDDTVKKKVCRELKISESAVKRLKELGFIKDGTF